MHEHLMHEPRESRRFRRERGGRRRHGPAGRHFDRARRGDVRAAVLLLLAEQPMHGYQLIQEITDRTDGAWRPSAGAVYPALALLEDEGLVTITAEGGRKLAGLTDEGRTYVEAHHDSFGDPFTVAGPRHGLGDLREQFGDLLITARLVARTGTEEQIAQVRALLAETKRELYRILAADDG
jgi:DNA-binding PadR family transcriptional regulator